MTRSWSVARLNPANREKLSMLTKFKESFKASQAGYHG